MSAVRLDGVSFSYPGATEPALAGVSVELRDGEIAWLFGSLGAGCSTLLLVAGGLAPRHTGGQLAGRVRALGVDPGSAAGRVVLAGKVAYVTATPGLQLSGIAATVWEEVAFTPANLGWPLERIRGAAETALARLGVAHLAERDPATLSGGELQRVVIASMLALAPPLWLLDEPAAPLDAGGRAVFAEVLREQAARGAAVVVASEDADLLAGLASRVLLLRHGRIAADGDPAKILAGEEVWRDGPGSTAVAALARRAARHARSPLLAPPYPLTVAEALGRWT